MQRLANIVQLCVAWCNLESSGGGGGGGIGRRRRWTRAGHKGMRMRERARERGNVHAEGEEPE
jgi:hypothetical protein